MQGAVNAFTRGRRFVDDAPNHYQQTLNKLGHTEIVETSNGREGIDRLNVTDVDIAITDCNMPEMNGIEFIRAPLRLDKMKETPILIVTTNAAKHDIV